MKNKLFYTQPTTDLLELRVEGLVCASVLLFNEATDTEVVVIEEPEDF